MRIGFAISTLRKTRGLSQGNLAEMVEISQTSLSLIELNKRTPHAKTLKKIALALEVTEPIVYLLSIDEEDIPKKNKALFNAIYPTIEKLFYQIFDLKL